MKSGAFFPKKIFVFWWGFRPRPCLGLALAAYEECEAPQTTILKAHILIIHNRFSAHNNS